MDPNQLASTLDAQYMYALTQQINLDGVPQIVRPYQVWDWGGTTYPIGSVPYAQVAALDMVPNTPDLDSTSTGVAGTGFGANYNMFLNFLNPTPNPSPQYQALQQSLTNALSAQYTANQQALAAWTNFKNSTGSTETYTAWLANEGSALQGQINAANQQVTAAQAAITSYLNSVSGPITTALANYTKGLISVVDQAGQSVSVPPWFTDVTPYAYVNEITNNNFGNDATNGSVVSFSVSQSTEQYQNSEVWGKAGFGGLLDWIGIEAGGTFKQVDTSSFSSQYSVEFQFQDLRAIQVTPGPWYDPSMPENYREGPFSPGKSGYASGNDVYYFGQGGNLARIYTGMVVGYRPTVVLNAGEEFASYFNQQITAESVVWIGPFAFDASGGSDTTAGSVEVDGATITAKSKGDWPYIVAMVSNWTAPPTA